MKPFRYLLDGLCLVACGSYALNRWVLKPHLHSPFLHNHFNDLLLIPAALPIVLWMQRKLKLRQNDDPPSWAEMVFHATIWSIICEGIGPLWVHHGTADPWDVVSYFVGGVIACLWWNRNSLVKKYSHEL